MEQVALAADQTVEEALALLACALHVSDVSFSLTADCFVDWLSRRDNELHYSVMLPGRLVASWVGENRQLAGLPWSTFYQHEYREIDESFPYQTCTLSQLGVPAHDVLHVLADGQDYYLEMVA